MNESKIHIITYLILHIIIGSCIVFFIAESDSGFRAALLFLLYLIAFNIGRIKEILSYEEEEENRLDTIDRYKKKYPENVMKKEKIDD